MVCISVKGRAEDTMKQWRRWILQANLGDQNRAGGESSEDTRGQASCSVFVNHRLIEIDKAVASYFHAHLFLNLTLPSVAKEHRQTSSH